MATVDLKSISHLLDATSVAADAEDSSSSERVKETQPWERFFSQLQEWQESPGHEDEDGYVSPSQISISTSQALLEALRKAGVTAPSRLVMNGDGGTVVKFTEGDSGKSVFEIEENGEIELRRYKNSRVVSQTEIKL